MFNFRKIKNIVWILILHSLTNFRAIRVYQRIKTQNSLLNFYLNNVIIHKTY